LDLWDHVRGQLELLAGVVEQPDLERGEAVIEGARHLFVGGRAGRRQRGPAKIEDAGADHHGGDHGHDDEPSGHTRDFSAARMRARGSIWQTGLTPVRY